MVADVFDSESTEPTAEPVVVVAAAAGGGGGDIIPESPIPSSLSSSQALRTPYVEAISDQVRYCTIFWRLLGSINIIEPAQCGN